MHKLAAWTLAWVAVLSLACHFPSAAETQPAPLVTVDECRNLSDAEVRDHIRDLASTSLKAELTNINYTALVDTYWAKANVNARIDREVDDAVAAVRENSS